jgi:hypothetical protein
MSEIKVFWLSDEQVYKVWATSKEEALTVYDNYVKTGEGSVKLKEQYIEAQGEE